jgi:hypothetical protein
VNRSWNGFLPQNELVKLQWAALEESQSESARKTSLLFCKLTVEGAPGEPDQDEDVPPPLPFQRLGEC